MGKTFPCLKHFPDAAGVDEVGRGCLAGPVVAAAVILPREFDTRGLNDSKLLTRKQREEWAAKIRNEAIYSLAMQSPEDIDRYNILQATLLAMAATVMQLQPKPKKVFVDGHRLPNQLLGYYELYPVVGGDSKIACIAAASIIAKTERDQLMRTLSEKYPHYGFENNVGYGTRQHLEAIEKFGPSPLHRKTFAPIKHMINQKCLNYDE